MVTLNLDERELKLSKMMDVIKPVTTCPAERHKEDLSPPFSASDQFHGRTQADKKSPTEVHHVMVL